MLTIQDLIEAMNRLTYSSLVHCSTIHIKASSYTQVVQVPAHSSLSINQFSLLLVRTTGDHSRETQMCSAHAITSFYH